MKRILSFISHFVELSHGSTMFSTSSLDEPALHPPRMVLLAGTAALGSLPAPQYGVWTKNTEFWWELDVKFGADR